MIIQDLQYNCEGYMALALAQYETFSSLLEVTFIGVRMAYQIRYRTACVPLCIGCVSLCHREGGLYIYLPSESNGPNLLDEPLKDFIVNPVDLPWKWVKRLATSGERANHDSWVKLYNLYRV